MPALTMGLNEAPSSYLSAKLIVLIKRMEVITMATEKQLRFFMSLRDELGSEVSEADVKRFLSLPVPDASAEIDRLLKQRSVRKSADSEPE